jgi:chorismate mutase/prephenate dehydratase
MSKKKRRQSGSHPSRSRGPNLGQLRTLIDKLDVQILKLLNERAKVAAQIGQLKADNGVDVFNPAREEEILARILNLNHGPLDNRSVRAFFQELMSASRALQRRLRVAYLGPEYSFSHLAALEKFGTSIEYVPVNNIAAVFESVARHQADFGIVPVENSTDGRIADTLDMFIRTPLTICAEISLRIHHYLLAMCDQSEIRRVYSKPQALSQCRHWLTANLPLAQTKEVASTTTAVQLAKQEPFAAAIASRQAASAYGLRIICADIEDRANNITRFAVIGHQPGERTGSDKTTIMFQIADRAGALCDALANFKRHKVNMTWIESFPAANQGSVQQYVFFADLVGHVKDARVRNTLAALQRKAEKIVILGSYPRGLCYD